MEFCVKLLSLPLWERGLKSSYEISYHKRELVAPLVGAWIEIYSFPGLGMLFTSLPLWERGLKLNECDFAYNRVMSLPLWERGLKYPGTSPLPLAIPSLPLWERGLK